MTTKFRKLKTVIQARLAESSPKIQVIVGPRQVGKTTALKAALEGLGVYKSADGPVPLEASVIKEWWREMLGSPERILAIDEVQKITNWSEAVKELWDQANNVKLVLTGSSAILVEKGLKETLAGRFELIRAEHWNFSEAQTVFGLSLNEFITIGCYPGAISLRDDLRRWSDYVKDSIIEPAIGRDLLQLHPVEKPALLRQVFGVAVSHPAQIISIQKIQGTLQDKGSIATIQNYLHLLSQAFLISGIEKYSKASIRAKKSSPKLITHDNALLRSFERPITKPITNELLGHYFENAVGARLIEAGWDLYYWKDKNHEVDYVALGPDGEKLALEVKSAACDEKELKGLRTFCEIHPDFEPRLVSLVNQKILGTTSWPCEEVLSVCHKY